MKEQSDLVLHCLHMLFCQIFGIQTFWTFTILQTHDRFMYAELAVDQSNWSGPFSLGVMCWLVTQGFFGGQLLVVAIRRIFLYIFSPSIVVLVGYIEIHEHIEIHLYSEKHT